MIDVIFGGKDPPRTLSYTVDLGSGETKDLVADFTRQSSTFTGVTAR